MNFFPENFLPFWNLLFEHSDFFHECFKLDVRLNLEAVGSYELDLFFDEGKNANLLIRVERPVLVLIEDSHKLSERSNPGKSVQVRLILLENIFQNLFTQMLPCNIVFGQGIPNQCTLASTPNIAISVTLDFGDNCRVDWVERIEAFGVELNRRHGVAAVWSNVGHWSYLYNLGLSSFFLL